MKILLNSILFLSIVCHAQEFRFNSNGEFKIVQFTDLHHNPTSKTSFQTFETIQKVTAKENPDMIVITGDIITANPAKEGWNQLAEVMAKLKKPWTVTFGNHDEEHDFTKEEIYQLIRKKPYFFGEKGNASGVLNFSKPIYHNQKNEVAAVMYFIDSHDYVHNPILGKYDWIKQDQIQWYQKVSDAYTMQNQNTPVPSMMFFHIPLLEYNHVDQNPNKIGIKKEGVASPEVNSGLFSALLLQKDVMGIVTGHDHDNNYTGIYKNVALSFGNVTGADAYGELERGGKVYILKQDKFSFSSYISTPTKRDFKFHYPAGLSEVDENTQLMKAQKVNPTQKGLRYAYYEGEVERVADIQKLKPKKEGIAHQISIKEAEQEDHFAFKFDGYFYAPQDAYYKFYVYSDDGSVLKINDKIIIDNDGGHSPKRVENTIALEKGYHKIELLYFEDYMGQTLDAGFSSIASPEAAFGANDLFYD